MGIQKIVNALQYKLVQLIKQLIKLTANNEEWIYLERFMKINGEKIKTSKPLKLKVASTSCTYNNGLAIEKIKEKIIITTYTCVDGVCEMNNISEHTLDFKAIKMSTNLFGDGELPGNPTFDPDSLYYLIQMMSEYVDIAETEKTSFWDVKK